MSDSVTGNYTTGELLGAIEALIAWAVSAAEAAGKLPDPVIQRAKKALELLRS